MNAQQEVVDDSKSDATSPTVTSSVRPKLTLTAPSIKPLFGSNTRAIVWGMQTRAVQVNYFYYYYLFISKKQKYVGPTETHVGAQETTSYNGPMVLTFNAMSA